MFRIDAKDIQKLTDNLRKSSKSDYPLAAVSYTHLDVYKRQARYDVDFYYRNIAGKRV